MEKIKLFIQSDDVKDPVKLWDIIVELNNKINELVEDSNNLKKNQPGIIRAKV